MDELTKEVLIRNARAARELATAGGEVLQWGASIPLLRLFVRQAIDVGRSAAGALDELISIANETGDGTPAAEQTPKLPRPPSAGGEHRHKFNAAGVCEVTPAGASAPCGKIKSNRGPKSAAADAPPPVDPRRTAHPAVGINLAAAERFANGGQGSTSTAERGR